jgi:cyclophilin family peptidyl-prolyl cis-trans isomerase
MKKAAIETSMGTITLELDDAKAPETVANFVKYAKDGHYDGTIFHRVIDGFMAQTGDVKFGKTGGPDFNLANAGMGGSDQPDVVAEFNSESFQRGVLGAARSQAPDSFNSQFFITTADASFLDGQYTVFGHVVEGLDIVEKIQRTPTDSLDRPVEDVRIIKATVLE